MLRSSVDAGAPRSAPIRACSGLMEQVPFRVGSGPCNTELGMVMVCLEIDDEESIVMIIVELLQRRRRRVAHARVGSLRRGSTCSAERPSASAHSNLEPCPWSLPSPTATTTTTTSAFVSCFGLPAQGVIRSSIALHNTRLTTATTHHYFAWRRREQSFPQQESCRAYTYRPTLREATSFLGRIEGTRASQQRRSSVARAPIVIPHPRVCAEKETEERQEDCEVRTLPRHKHPVECAC